MVALAYHRAAGGRRWWVAFKAGRYSGTVPQGELAELLTHQAIFEWLSWASGDPSPDMDAYAG